MKVFSVFHKLLLTKTLSTISHSFEYYYLQYLCIQNAISDQINKKFEKGWTQLWINIKRVLFVWICFSFPTNLSLTLLIPGIRLLLSCLQNKPLEGQSENSEKLLFCVERKSFVVVLRWVGLPKRPESGFSFALTQLTLSILFLLFFLLDIFLPYILCSYFFSIFNPPGIILRHF